jgi:hypothetical protein
MRKGPCHWRGQKNGKVKKNQTNGKLNWKANQETLNEHRKI